MICAHKNGNVNKYQMYLEIYVNVKMKGNKSVKERKNESEEEMANILYGIALCSMSNENIHST